MNGKEGNRFLSLPMQALAISMQALGGELQLVASYSGLFKHVYYHSVATGIIIVSFSCS